MKRNKLSQDQQMPQDAKEATPNPKSKKQSKGFSKSGDGNEDRGWRQIKTINNSQTFFRMCGDFDP
jgi:hypothetical protein